jgi:peptide deformylase
MIVNKDVEQPEEVELKEEPKTIIYEVDGIKLPEIGTDFCMQLKYYPDPVLSVPCEDITTKSFEDDMLLNISSQMIQTMYNSVGIGLAGPQIGFPYRIFVWDTNWPNTGERKPNVIFNPEIVKTEDELQTNREGCLSVAFGWHVDITRPNEVVIKGLNLHGEEVQYVGYGMTAACFQHEIEHLNGTLIVDYDGKLRRDLYNKKIIKYARRRRNCVYGKIMLRSRRLRKEGAERRKRKDEKVQQVQS